MKKLKKSLLFVLPFYPYCLKKHGLITVDPFSKAEILFKGTWELQGKTELNRKLEEDIYRNKEELRFGVDPFFVKLVFLPLSAKKI